MHAQTQMHAMGQTWTTSRLWVDREQSTSMTQPAPQLCSGAVTGDRQILPHATGASGTRFIIVFHGDPWSGTQHASHQERLPCRWMNVEER